MPVKLWQKDDNNRYTSRIVTKWDSPLGGEEYRADAEELDKRLDGVLDDSLSLLGELSGVAINIRFKRIWCVGRCVRESGVLRLPALRTERRVLLWRAMAWKCWLGTRHDYPNSMQEPRWRELRPGKQAEPKDPFRTRELFEIGLWLQQQELNDAAFIFGGSVSNSIAIGRRTSINALAMREALKKWLQNLSPEHRDAVHTKGNFGKVAKALRQCWPDAGFGAARRPEHYSPEELLTEVREVLEPVLKDILNNQRVK